MFFFGFFSSVRLDRSGGNGDFAAVPAARRLSPRLLRGRRRRGRALRRPLGRDSERGQAGARGRRRHRRRRRVCA